MTKTRLEAFSDGVIAIALTIMVLELKAPHGTQWSDLNPLLPAFLAYVLSFVNIGIYWNNHHHLLHATDHVDGRILWANMHLLFWLSLMPFVTAWMAENHFAVIPTATYGFVLLMAGLAYSFLVKSILAHGDANHALREALDKDWKGMASIIVYIVAVILAFASQWIAIVLYVLVACAWFIPDKRIERRVHGRH